jgi:predicted translin family RNA/ssDNA-binding protein
MSKELAKMNLIAIVQKLPKEDIEYIQDYVVFMENEIEKLKSKLELYENDVYYSSEVDELQNRIDEAIEYVENFKDSCNCYERDLEITLEKLLQILKGTDNENE